MPSSARLLTLATLLFVPACAAPDASDSGAAGTTPEVRTGLADLHDANRVPGLEDRRFSYGEYWGVLLPILQAHDEFKVDVAGVSAEGRDIRAIQWGDGPTQVLLWSQMHGNEATASMTLVDLFHLLGSQPDHPAVAAIREGATLTFIPMLNPDGSERFQRRNAQGVDINRDARLLATPEGRTLKAVRDAVEPDFAFNLHDQNVGTRVGDSDRGAAIALLSPPFDETREVDARRKAAIEVAGVIVQAIDPMVEGHVAKYDDSFNPRAFGDLITTWGASTILIESGGWEGDVQKQYLRKVNFVGLVAALEAIATGSHEGVSMALYDDLPYNGRRFGDLKLTGGTLVFPGLPAMRADLMLNFRENLSFEGGTIAEIGDLGETEARFTMDLAGMYIHPAGSALDRSDGGIQITLGSPATFRVTRDEAGTDVVWEMEQDLPDEVTGGLGGAYANR
jgi:hypothetical protein